jgi:hypothetical protein
VITMLSDRSVGKRDLPISYLPTYRNIPHYSLSILRISESDSSIISAVSYSLMAISSGRSFAFNQHMTSAIGIAPINDARSSST